MLKAVDLIEKRDSFVGKLKTDKEKNMGMENKNSLKIRKKDLII